MKTRGAFIGFGTVLLVLGLTGLALLQTGVITPPSPVTGRTLELQTQEQQSSGPGPLASAGGKLPPPPPPETPSPPPEPAAPSVQPPAPRETPEAKTIPVPKVGKGVRSYPRQDQVEPPVVKEKKQVMGKQSERRIQSKQSARKGSTAGAGYKQYSTGKGAASVGKRSAGPAARGKQPTVVRFKFDPSRNRELNVARVHFGDRVVVRVRRVGQADNQVYLTFMLPDTGGSQGYRGWSAGRKTAIITPVRDHDQLTLTAEREFGPGLTEKLESREGAVLKVGARPDRNARSRGARYDRGYYEIEMRIYSANRWNLKPRSYL